MPNLGNGLNKLENLKSNDYAWVAISDGEIIDENKFKIVNDSKNLYPWKLVQKNINKFFNNLYLNDID